MRIGVVTPWDIDDTRAWSGVVRPMVAALAERAEVVPFPTGGVRDSIVDRALARTLDRRFGRRYLVGHAVATGFKRGRELSRRLRETPVDVILAIAASQDIAFVRTDAPVIQVSDTTFAAIRNFYPLFSHLNPLSSWQAEIQAKRSARATRHTLAATGWARDALIRDDGFSPDQVTVAPFGPAVVPTGGEPARPDGGPLRILMVSSDWERKAGPDVLATVRELQRRGHDVELTVVGDAPTLPEGVHSVGRVAQDRMRELYATHHVLLELSHSNAAGVTATDAAAFGLSVVAADTGGMSSIVLDGRTGFLVQPGAITEAADRVEALTAPDVRARVNAAARVHAETSLNWGAWADVAVQTCQAAIDPVGAASPRSGRPGPRADRGIVVLSPSVPYPGIEHAGGQYLRRLHEAISPHSMPCWMAMDRPSLRHSLCQPGVAPHVIVLGDSTTRQPVRRAAYRAAGWVEAQLARVDSQPIPVAAALDLLTNADVRRRIRQAELVDFQWANYTKLSGIVRILNPRARLHFTFHDVMSQKCDRHAATAPDALRRLRWRLASFLARRWERRAVSRADVCVVFSDKDRELLDPRGTGNVVVIDPPLADGGSSDHAANADGRVLFVGFMARKENVDGLLWFLHTVWPEVQARVPGCSLRVAGGAMPPEIEQRIQRQHRGVDLLGFVPDLTDEYRLASAVIVPLHDGAGVKFKTIDALLAGAPVVTTPVGAEGIGAHDLFAGLTDSPAGFAAALVRTLRDNEEAVERARPVQAWAGQRYSLARFQAVARLLYVERAPGAAVTSASPSAS